LGKTPETDTVSFIQTAKLTVVEAGIVPTTPDKDVKVLIVTQ
jgi:hypothetical protein